MPDPLHDPTADRPPDPEAVGRVLAYHELSKHHRHSYAPAPVALDWANQPDPFRTFAGAPAVELPLLADALRTSYADLYDPAPAGPKRADVNSVAVLFELALGLSAWKEYAGARWALRCNPSSGNLHPTEGYAALPAAPGLDGGVYHYAARDHALERRRKFTPAESAALADALPPGCLLVGLSSVHWREAWKYGARAFRYCQHDAGHALAAVRYAAAALGWSARLLDHAGDAAVAAWLGLDRDGFAGLDPLDREHPVALALVGPAPLPDALPVPPALGDGPWLGRASRLSPGHVRWDEIDDVAAATWGPATAPRPAPQSPPLPPPKAGPPVPAATLIRRRRSCLALDGRTALDADDFYSMFDRLLPRPGVAPWDLFPWRPLVHAFVFVHRVRGLETGLYLFERAPEAHAALRPACSPGFAWRRPAGCPAHLGLYLLAGGDYRQAARTLSCHQEIAADGAFSLGMIAALGGTVRGRGAWWYRRVFWEAGVLGHVLYLEAETAGVRGTGIGCYFDDPCHRLLGLSGDAWQDVYHFAAGGPVEDRRLRTMGPYAHLHGRG